MKLLSFTISPVNIRMVFFVCVRIHVRELGYTCTIEEVNRLFGVSADECVHELQKYRNLSRIKDLKERRDTLTDVVAKYVGNMPDIPKIMGREPDRYREMRSSHWSCIVTQGSEL